MAVHEHTIGLSARFLQIGRAVGVDYVDYLLSGEFFLCQRDDLLLCHYAIPQLLIP